MTSLPMLICLQILIRLEKYHYRINFAKGILESRNVTYDRSMRKLAKALPLDTPTTIELAPGYSIQVTLIDANHCVGAVMFLIEGNGKAILYTGDIRAETWWVNSLVQNPILLPYTLGTRRLECMYLDTTFATKNTPYKGFPSKAEGIRELLSKVSEYPEDTIFYFHSWTFGYENVWLALSAFLKSRIHLDDYRARIYGSLSTLDRKQLREVGLNVPADTKSLRESGLEIREAPALCGFKNGNHIQPGCLTSHENVRIHSCERGMGCQVIDHDKKAKAVHIIPIVTRTNGVEIAELGAGGGKGDMDQKEELETGDIAAIGKLMELCAKTIQDETLLSKVLSLLQQSLAGGDGRLDLEMQIQKASGESQNGLSLQMLVSVLSTNASKDATIEMPRNRTIRFPYSRHSSYSELCELVAAFKPKDVFPCTVDESRWTPDLSMQNLFGQYCGDKVFRHDAEMMKMYELRLQQQREKRAREETQQDTQTTDEQLPPSPISAKRFREADAESDDSSNEAEFATPAEKLDGTKDRPIEVDEAVVPETSQPATPSKADLREEQQPTPFPVPIITVEQSSALPTIESTPAAQILATPQDASISAPPPLPTTPAPPPSSTTSSTKQRRKKWTNSRIAYEAAIGTHLTWADYGGLTCTRTSADREEEEL
jgi:hypothetical protein